MFTGVCRCLPVLVGVYRCLRVFTGAYRCLYGHRPVFEGA